MRVSLLMLPVLFLFFGQIEGEIPYTKPPNVYEVASLEELETVKPDKRDCLIFSTDSCRYCIQIHTEILGFAANHPRIRFVFLDTDNLQHLKEANQLRMYPTVFFGTRRSNGKPSIDVMNKELRDLHARNVEESLLKEANEKQSNGESDK